MCKMRLTVLERPAEDAEIVSAVLGIDPGLDGAAVLLAGDEPPHFFDTPTLNVGRGKAVRRVYAETEMARTIRDIAAETPGLFAFLEQVHSMPGQGVRSMFTMGTGYGLWLGILSALQIPFAVVTPQRWKGALMDGQGKEKDASRARAMQLFPTASASLARKKDVDRADALLIAEYGRRILQSPKAEGETGLSETNAD